MLGVLAMLAGFAIYAILFDSSKRLSRRKAVSHWERESTPKHCTSQREWRKVKHYVKRTSQMKIATEKPTMWREDETNQLETGSRSDGLLV